MNVIELNSGGYTTLARFLEVMLPLTFVTIWIVVAFQSRLVLRDEHGAVWKQLLWPLVYLNALIPQRPSTTKEDDVELSMRRKY